MIRRTLLVLTIVGLAAVSLTTPASGAVSTCTGTGRTFAGGSGTSADPYLIATPTDLVNIVSGYYACSFLQTANLSLSGTWTPIGTSAARFTGEYDGGSHSIAGISITDATTKWHGLFGFIGAGGLVEDLSISGSVVGDEEVGGLAGEIVGATIRNVTSTVTVRGDNYVGGLVGTASKSGSTFPEFTNVRVNADVFGIGQTGGLIGDSYGVLVSEATVVGDVTCTATGVLLDCGGLVGYMSKSGIGNPNSVFEDVTVDGDVTASSGNLGGFFGYAEHVTLRTATFRGTVTGSATDNAQTRYVGGAIGWSDTPGAFQNPSVLSSVTVDAVVKGASNVGGLIGSSEGDTITDSTVSGSVTGSGELVGGLLGDSSSGTSVTDSWSTANVLAASQGGGLIGFATRTTTVNRSWASGQVSATGSTQKWFGGLVGYLDNGAAINDSYARGAVTGKVSIGGLVGEIDRGTVDRSFSTGVVTDADGATTPDTVGGLVGSSLSGVVRNSFWDATTSGRSVSAGGTASTTTLMKTLPLFADAGWSIVEGSDCSSTWGLMSSRNDGYPYLQVFYARACSDTSQLPPSWYQSMTRASSASECPSGWTPGWAEWPNGRTGGFVCNREIYWDLTRDGWSIR